MYPFDFCSVVLLVVKLEPDVNARLHIYSCPTKELMLNCSGILYVIGW